MDEGLARLEVILGTLMVTPVPYGYFHASVLMGSFHDQRSGGQQAHGMFSKSLSGTGKGSIDFKIVKIKSSLDVKAWD